MESLTLTKKELLEFLDERRRYIINYEDNPFKEARLVSYITNGMELLKKYNDNDLLKLYDLNNELCVEEVK